MRSTACRCRCSRRRSRFPPRKKLVPRPSTARSFYFASGGQDRPQLSNLSRLFTGRDRSNFAQIAEHCGRRRALVAASPGRRSVNDRQIGRRAARACAMLIRVASPVAGASLITRGKCLYHPRNLLRARRRSFFAVGLRSSKIIQKSSALPLPVKTGRKASTKVSQMMSAGSLFVSDTRRRSPEILPP